LDRCVGSAGDQQPDLFLKHTTGGIWAFADQQVGAATHLRRKARAQRGSEWTMKPWMNLDENNANGF